MISSTRMYFSKLFLNLQKLFACKKGKTVAQKFLFFFEKNFVKLFFKQFVNFTKNLQCNQFPNVTTHTIDSKYELTVGT